MNIYGFIIAGLALLIYALQAYLHSRQVNKMLNRIMARNYEEFKYYEEKYPEDIKEVKKMRADDREEREELKEEPLDDAKAKEFEQHLEEDWSPEELDLEKVKEGLKDES